MTTEEMQALRDMMREELEPLTKDVATLKGNVDALQTSMVALQSDVAAMKEDIADIKENVQINRHIGNLLLGWAEKADRSLNIGLYNQQE